MFERRPGPSYTGWLAGSYRDIIHGLDDLDDMQRRFLDTRWLDLVLWHEARAERASKMYYRLRITTLVGGATATAFASLKLSGTPGVWISALIFALTLATTIAAGLEELLKFGDQRTRFREIAERLKREGWLFFQLAGPYAGRPEIGHRDGFRRFTEQIEEIAQDGGGPRRASVGFGASPSARQG
jgi:hypothetical protein